MTNDTRRWRDTNKVYRLIDTLADTALRVTEVLYRRAETHRVL